MSSCRWRPAREVSAPQKSRKAIRNEPRQPRAASVAAAAAAVASEDPCWGLLLPSASCSMSAWLVHATHSSPGRTSSIAARSAWQGFGTTMLLGGMPAPPSSARTVRSARVSSASAHWLPPPVPGLDMTASTTAASQSLTASLAPALSRAASRARPRGNAAGSSGAGCAVACAWRSPPPRAGALPLAARLESTDRTIPPPRSAATAHRAMQATRSSLARRHQRL
mmetsp:Transcript_22371/g.69241  ORF Transcript_22371/g.69241 Transcript_22371/m.69241 type:complete len:224 (-) Transcript_22371:27-698(-)